MPSVAGVAAVRDGEPRLVIGQEAVDLSGASRVRAADNWYKYFSGEDICEEDFY